MPLPLASHPDAADAPRDELSGLSDLSQTATEPLEWI